MNLTDARTLAEIPGIAPLLPRLNAAFPGWAWMLDPETGRVTAQEVRASDAGVWLGLSFDRIDKAADCQSIPPALAQLVRAMEVSQRSAIATIVREPPSAAFRRALGFDETTGEALYQDDGA